MALLRIAALLPLMGLCHSLPPQCSYWKLWDHLNLTTTNNFVANVRPVTSWTSVTTVHIEMILNSILNLDEKSQTLQVHTWTTTYWSNEFVKWNPSDFCDIKVVTVLRSLVWIPDIHIEEDVSDSSNSQDSPYVNLYSSGWASATSSSHLTFTCQLNLNLFPFDEQKCNITFSSMTADAQAIVLRVQKNGTQLTDDLVTVTLGEWDLHSIDIEASLKTNKDNVTRSQLVYMESTRQRVLKNMIEQMKAEML